MTDVLGFVPAGKPSTGNPFLVLSQFQTPPSPAIPVGTTYFPSQRTAYDARGWGSLLVFLTMDSAQPTQGITVEIEWVTTPDLSIQTPRVWTNTLITRAFERSTFDTIPVTTGWFRVAITNTGPNPTLIALSILPKAATGMVPHSLTDNLIYNLSNQSVAGSTIFEGIIPFATTGSATISIYTTAQSYIADVEAGFANGTHAQYLWLWADTVAFSGAAVTNTQTDKFTLAPLALYFHFNNRDPIAKIVTVGITLDPL